MIVVLEAVNMGRECSQVALAATTGTLNKRLGGPVIDPSSEESQGINVAFTYRRIGYVNPERLR